MCDPSVWQMVEGLAGSPCLRLPRGDPHLPPRLFSVGDAEVSLKASPQPRCLLVFPVRSAGPPGRGWHGDAVPRCSTLSPLAGSRAVLGLAAFLLTSPLLTKAFLAVSCLITHCAPGSPAPRHRLAPPGKNLGAVLSPLALHPAPGPPTQWTWTNPPVSRPVG